MATSRAMRQPRPRNGKPKWRRANGLFTPLRKSPTAAETAPAGCAPSSPLNNAHCRARSNNSCGPTSAKSRCNTLSESFQKWGVPLNVRFFPQALRCASSGNEAPARDFRLTESGGILSDHLKAAFRKGLRLFCNAKQAVCANFFGRAACAKSAREMRFFETLPLKCSQNTYNTVKPY